MDYLDENCWKGYHKEGNKEMFGKTVPNCVKNEAVSESHESCPECGGAMYPDTMINEKQDACYYKVKSRYKVWPSAYASGALVQCRKKGAANWGNKSKNESVENTMDELSRILELAGKPVAGKQLNEAAEGRVDPILIKALNRMPDGLATHREVLDAAYDAYAMELGKMAMRSEYGVTNRYIPQLLSLYKDKHGLTFNEDQEELNEEFDLIESIIEDLAASNGVDSEVIWEDLESLDDDELYVFAATSTIMETEAWQKANNRDRTNGMSRKAVKAYRREHPGSKLQTAVTTKPSKLKKGSKASKRRKSYCSRSKGQMKMHNISCAKTPDKAICKARRRWNC